MSNIIVDLKIGRDANTGKLSIATAGKTMLAGEADSVPKSVSREHLHLTMDDEGIIILENINIENDLYVNGYAVERKRIDRGARIELGHKRYLLSWNILGKVVPPVADIRPLEQVWKHYQDERLRLQIKERRFGVIRSATGILTTAAMVLGVMEIGGNGNSLRSILYCTSFLITLLCFALAYRAASRMPRRLQQLDEQTRQQYKCPHCGCLFNLQSYDMLRQMHKCPHCWAIIKK